MRLKLVNGPEGINRFPGRISVVNAETGEALNWVRSVVLTADISTEWQPVATIQVDVELDIDTVGDVEAIFR